MKKTLLALGLCLAGLVQTPDASAWMKYCNNSGATIWTTFEWYSGCTDGDVPWTKKGWWKIDHGTCKTVSSLDLDYNNYYYYYAHGGGRTWSGPYNSCVSDNAFEWCDSTCQIPGGGNPGWRELNVGDDVSNYTLTFNP